jgi:hypothetical protein
LQAGNAGTQLTYFTGTTAQILTLEKLQAVARRLGAAGAAAKAASGLMMMRMTMTRPLHTRQRRQRAGDRRGRYSSILRPHTLVA